MALESYSDLHTYLQQYPLTAFWFEKRNLILEIRQKINPTHPLVPDLSSSTFMHFGDEFLSDQEFDSRMKIMSTQMLFKVIAVKEVLLWLQSHQSCSN